MRRGLEKTLRAACGVALALALVHPATAQESESRQERGRVPMAITVADGGGGYLGVRIADVTAEVVDEMGLSGEYGVHVTSVVEEGPAAEAGLQDGDIIVRWNGERLESVAQLQRLTSETPPGRTVEVGVIRDGSQQEFSVELGSRSRSFGGTNVFTVPRERVALARPQTQAIRDRVGTAFRAGQTGNAYSLMMGRPRLGVSIQSLGDQLAEYFGVEGGALVTDVTEDSPAGEAGIQAGDVIVSVDGSDVEGPGDVLEALSEIESGPVEITVVRDGARRTFTAELEESENRWRGRGGAFYFNREGEEPSFEGFEVGPVQWEGVQIEPMQFDFDWAGEPIEISIPAIDVPGFEIPAIDMSGFEMPHFEFQMPRITIIV